MLCRVAIHNQQMVAVIDLLVWAGVTHCSAKCCCDLQTLLAAGLLQLRPMKPRTIGLIGVIASLMNCYMLYPKLPPPALTPPKSYAEAASSTTQSKMELKKA